jgi:hypothetical protein
MATSTSNANPAPINLGQYFHAPAQPANPQQQQQARPGIFSRAYRGVQSLVYTPVRNATEEAAQGFANRVTELFNDNQEEIINRVRNVFTEALLRRCPENIHRLLTAIQAFLRAPSQADLDQIKQLLNGLDANGLRAIASSVNDTGIQQLTTLRALLDTDVTGPANALVVTANATLRLQIAEGILSTIMENHEGALLQTVSYLTQSLSEPNGFFQSLRHQFNHPQHGVIAEGLATLRQHLNGRVFLPLRESKAVCESYRSALSRNGSAAELIHLRQVLHGKLALLLGQRPSVPQISADHWTALEQFDAGIQNNNQPLPAHAQLIGQSDAAFQILSTSFNAQRGMIEEATDLMIEGIGRSITQLRNGVQNLLSPQPGAAAPAPPLPNPPAAGGAELNLGSIAAQGRRFLDSILSSAGNALSQQGARSLASLLRYVFEKIRDHIQQGPAEQQHLLGSTINPMIVRLQGSLDNGSWVELIAVLGDALQFMQNSQVYLQGLRLPLNPVRTHVSAIPEFLQNINSHQNALRTAADRAPARITAREISQKAELFQKRASSYGIAKMILEKFCGYQNNDGINAKIHNPGELSMNELSPAFRSRLFEKINEANTGFFGPITKWVAKMAYDFLLPIFSFFTNSVFGNLLEFAKKEISTQSINRESKEERMVRLARNWLAVTSGAYNQVASTPASQVRDFNVMMEDAIKMPERNGGLKQHELFAAAGKTLFETFGPRLKWSESVDQYFQAEIPASSPLHFLNFLVLGLNMFCSFSLKAILFIPQWIANLILQTGTKIAIGATPMLQNYTDSAIESLRRNTPASYSAQRVLYRQLQKVLMSLQQGLNDEGSNAGGLRSRDTNIKRYEIAGLVEYLMEVLNKSQYRTQDRLSNYLRHQAPIRDRAERELDDTFIPEVMETVVMTISVSLSAVTQEEEMQRMLYDGLCIANEMFDDQTPVTDADFATLERGIRELTDQILETAIFYAIDEKFDFTNEKQKRGIRQFVRSLKEESNAFTLQMYRLSTEMTDARSSTEYLAKVTEMIDFSARFNRQRVDALGKADGNRNFHTETKHHLNEMSRQLLTHCNPMAQRLNTMKGLADQLSLHDRLMAPLLLQCPILQTLGRTLQNQRLSSQEVTLCKTQLALLRGHVNTLLRNRCPVPITDEMQQCLQEFSIALQKMQESQKTNGTLLSAYRIFSELKDARLASIDPPSAHARNLERQLASAIQQLPSEQKEALNRPILQIMNAANAEEIEASARLFISLNVQFNARLMVEEGAYFASLRQSRDRLEARVNLASQEFTHQFALDKAALLQHTREAANQARLLNVWAQSQHELPIWNLFIFDMQWVTETVKNLAFERAQAKIKKLFETLYQRHNYIGLIHQGVLLPFLETYGKHHLRA